MSKSGEHLAQLLAALEAGGVRVAGGVKFSAPCVHIEPGDPWSEPERMPGRTSRWQLTAIAGRADAVGALQALGELIDKVDSGLRTIDGVQLPTWAKPRDYTLDGHPHAATVATIAMRTQT